MIHQSVVVICLVFLRKSTAQFFIHVHVSFALRRRSVVQFLLYLSTLVMFISVLFSVMFSILYFSILVMLMSGLCSAIFSFLYFSILVMFMSVLCSVIEVPFRFFFCILGVERNFFSLTVLESLSR